MAVRRLQIQAAKGGESGVHDDRDVAIVTLLLLAITCVTILFLKLAEPTGGLVELLFPRVEAESGRASGKINEGRSRHFPPGPLGWRHMDREQSRPLATRESWCRSGSAIARQQGGAVWSCVI